jgi:hypothetical protein
MLPNSRDYRRAARKIEIALEQPSRSADQRIETLLDAASGLLGIVGACWHNTDPASGLPIASAMLGDPAGSL